MNIGKLIVLPALFALAGPASAQTETPTPSPAAADGGARIEYRSVFSGYRPYRDQAVADWRQGNELVRRLNGHAGHAAGRDDRPADRTDQDSPAGSPSGRMPDDAPAHPGHDGGRP